MEKYEIIIKNLVYETTKIMLEEGYAISDLLYVISDAIKDYIEDEET